MPGLLIGTSAYANADVKLLHEAGIRWVRHGFPFPFADRLGGKLAEGYVKAKAEAGKQVARGLKLMGVTPLHGIGKFEPDAKGRMEMKWHSRLPKWMGKEGSPEFLRRYRAVCSFLAQDLRGVISAWQVSNELDIRQFGGALSPRQACEMILSGAQGLKEADPGLIVGTNTAGAPQAYYFYGRLFAFGGGDLDYCGVDGYFGTWQAGGPESWGPRIADLYELTRVKVLVNEWGYSSAGGLMSKKELAANRHVCQFKKWRYGWGAGHTPKGQAAFVREAFKVFRAHRAKLFGLFFYRWEDQPTCWQCGKPDCPAETAWGLVDLKGNPKPAFYEHKKGVKKLGG